MCLYQHYDHNKDAVLNMQNVSTFGKIPTDGANIKTDPTRLRILNLSHNIWRLPTHQQIHILTIYR